MPWLCPVWVELGTPAHGEREVVKNRPMCCAAPALQLHQAALHCSDARHCDMDTAPRVKREKQIRGAYMEKRDVENASCTESLM